MHADGEAQFFGPLQNLQNAVVVYFKVVGEVELKAGHPLLVPQFLHVGQHGLIHMLDHPVQAVINDTALGKAAVYLPLVAQGAARRAKGHVVYDGGGAAAGGGDAAGVEVVGRAGEAHVQIKVGVGVDAAGQQVAVFGIDDGGALKGGGLLPGGVHPGNQAVFHQHRAGENRLVGGNLGVLNQCAFWHNSASVSKNRKGGGRVTSPRHLIIAGYFALR